MELKNPWPVPIDNVNFKERTRLHARCIFGHGKKPDSYPWRIAFNLRKSYQEEKLQLAKTRNLIEISINCRNDLIIEGSCLWGPAREK
jgi:hypothetical protein